MRVLFVSPHPPLPLDNGGRLRTFHLLEALAGPAQVRLVCFDREPGTTVPCSREEIESALPGLDGVTVVPAPGGSKRARQAAALMTRRSYTHLMHSSAALSRTVAESLHDLQPDLVHCDGLFCAWVRDGTASRSGASWVLGMHNSESLLKRRLAETAPTSARRVLYRSEARAVESIERHHLSSFEHCVAVSDLERARFSAWSPSAATVPNGVDPQPEPGAPVRPEAGAPLRLLFVGSQNYEPNRLGLRWFVESVLPLLAERVRVEVDVVGAGYRGPRRPGLNVLGRVDDIGSAYRRAHAAVVPLRAGAGSRLKVVEALARGVPLVSTALGAEGYDLRDGQHALIADEPQALAERIVRLDGSLRGDGALAASLQEHGYRFARAYFWPDIGRRLVELYEGWG